VAARLLLALLLALAGKASAFARDLERLARYGKLP
jgi:hypothetical protein